MKTPGGLGGAGEGLAAIDGLGLTEKRVHVVQHDLVVLFV
jgi:hypothetical protein